MGNFTVKTLRTLGSQSALRPVNGAGQHRSGCTLDMTISYPRVNRVKRVEPNFLDFS